MVRNIRTVAVTSVFLGGTIKLVPLNPDQNSNPKKDKSMLIQKTQVPAPSRGVGATSSPQVSVRENGNIFVNKAVAKLIGLGNSYVTFDYEEATKNSEPIMTLVFANKAPKDKDTFYKEVKYSAKSGGYSFGASGVLQAVAYDFKRNGNQSFAATAKGTSVSFTLPERELTPPTKKARKSKKKTNGVDTTPHPVVATSEPNGALKEI